IVDAGGRLAGAITQASWGSGRIATTASRHLCTPRPGARTLHRARTAPPLTSSNLPVHPIHAAMSQSPQAAPSVSTGIKGLDHILGGGFTPNRLYLLEGEPGSGKTTMGLQFLLAGVQAGETVLYVTLSETRDELLETAGSHGW